VLENPEQPRFVKAEFQARLRLQNSLERGIDRFVFSYPPAGHEIVVFCWLISPQGDEDPPFRISNDQVDGDKRCVSNNIRKLFVCEIVYVVHCHGPACTPSGWCSRCHEFVDNSAGVNRAAEGSSLDHRFHETARLQFEVLPKQM
jgi:hypothetical protein